MGKATGAPMCQLCKTAHWAREGHDKAGLKAATKANRWPQPKPVQKHTQGRGAR